MNILSLSNLEDKLIDFCEKNNLNWELGSIKDDSFVLIIGETRYAFRVKNNQFYLAHDIFDNDIDRDIRTKMLSSIKEYNIKIMGFEQ